MPVSTRESRWAFVNVLRTFCGLAKAHEDAAAKARKERSKTPQVETVSLYVDTHSLRHFYASALIAGDASVKVAQSRLGHSSAVITLHTFGHPWPGDDDLTRTVMDSAFAILADSLRTSATVEGCTCREVVPGLVDFEWRSPA
jgi:integrase